MAAPIQVAADGQSITVGTLMPLFTTRVGRVLNPGPNAEYVPSADGRRFLMNTFVPDAGSAPIRIILNWRPGS